MAEKWTKVRSRIALEKRRDPDADVTELRREMRTAHLAAYIERTVAAAPALNAEQRNRLALLLSGGSDVTP